MDGEGSKGLKDLGTSNWKVASLLSETRGVREVSAAGNSDGVSGFDGSLMSPVENTERVCSDAEKPRQPDFNLNHVQIEGKYRWHQFKNKTAFT